MCELCYEEVDEATATKNGAQNWHRRKEALADCRKHGLVHVTNMGTGAYSCDVCEETIEDAEWRQHIDSNGRSTDVCRRCQPSENMANLLFQDASLSGLTRLDASGFGSLLDWIPIGHDEDPDTYGQYVNVVIGKRFC